MDSINQSAEYPAKRFSVKVSILTFTALIAFAANSVLCRLALGDHLIDAAGFTNIRLLSGVLALFLILKVTAKREPAPDKGSWMAALMLFVYAISFSYAYLSLDTGTGALILFGAVQISMVVLSIIGGNRLHPTEWFGLFIAFGGFVYLVLPGVTAPSPVGFTLMTISGIAWGVYTLKGSASRNPLSDTTYNFIRTLPFVIVLAVLTFQDLQLTPAGIWLAIVSGAVTSGIGYTIWYAALRGLSTTTAAVVQLSVPVIAAFGGIIFISESLTLRLGLATVLIIGGILLVILARKHYPASDKDTKTM